MTQGSHPSSPSPEGDRHFVTALARGLQVLSCFRSADRTLANQELAQRCGLPKSTVARLTHTLVQLGYLQGEGRHGQGPYRLGSATLALGSTMLARMDVRQAARPLMQTLADATHTMVSLGTRDRLSMIYVENCRSDAAQELTLDVGSRIPLATTAMGRAYLACCPEPERADLMERLREYDEYAWPSLQAGIQRAIEEHQTLGVCGSFGDWQPDVNAIAVGFQPRDAHTWMSLNCGGPTGLVSRRHLLDVVRPQMLEIVRRLQA